MGTKADFYLGRGASARWLGSVHYDGYRGVDERVLGRFRRGAFAKVRTARDFERAVNAWLRDAERDNSPVVRPKDGWPWPWADSCLTDYAYAWDARAVWVTEPCDPTRGVCRTCKQDRNVWRRLGDKKTANAVLEIATFPRHGGAKDVRVSHASVMLIRG